MKFGRNTKSTYQLRILIPHLFSSPSGHFFVGPPEKSSDLAPLESLGAASLRIVIQSLEFLRTRFVRMESHAVFWAPRHVQFKKNNISLQVEECQKPMDLACQSSQTVFRWQTMWHVASRMPPSFEVPRAAKSQVSLGNLICQPVFPCATHVQRMCNAYMSVSNCCAGENGHRPDYNSA